MNDFLKIPKKYHPKGYSFLYEDRDLMVGCKEPGFLTVAAAWNKENTIHRALNMYVRRGNVKSFNRAYVVHRLDQDTSGVLIFAKSQKTQEALKESWKSTVKIYYAIVYGHLSRKSGTITSFLEEDEEYVVHSVKDSRKGKLARTEYEVLKENAHFSLLKINLLTGRKNQIRVHLADLGHPIVGDEKYGKTERRHQHYLALHARSIEFTHPFTKKRLKFEAPFPDYFKKLVDYAY